MVASSTKRKLAKEAILRGVVETAAELTARYVAQWTQKEYSKLIASNRVPYIYPLNNGGFSIGRLFLIPSSNHWQIQNQSREVIYEIDSKEAAIFFCLCDQIGFNKLADEIRLLDRDASKYKVDILHYTRSLERAIKTKNCTAISVWDARLEDAQLRYSSAKNQLQKSIRSAKYLKVWETNHEINRNRQSATSYKN
jgi:hypothetical protein